MSTRLELTEAKHKLLQEHEEAKCKDYLEKYPLGVFSLRRSIPNTKNSLDIHPDSIKLAWYGAVVSAAGGYFHPAYVARMDHGDYNFNKLKPQYKKLDLSETYNGLDNFFSQEFKLPNTFHKITSSNHYLYHEINAKANTLDKFIARLHKEQIDQKYINEFIDQLNKSYYPVKKLLHDLNATLKEKDIYVNYKFEIYNIRTNDHIITSTLETLQKDLSVLV